MDEHVAYHQVYDLLLQKTIAHDAHKASAILPTTDKDLFLLDKAFLSGVDFVIDEVNVVIMLRVKIVVPLRLTTFFSVRI